MNTRRRDMKQRNKNISCTNYEIENTAVHAVRYQKKSRTQDRETKTVQPQPLRTNTKSVHGKQTATSVWHKTCVHGNRGAWETSFNISLAQNLRARETNFNARRQTSALDEEYQTHLLPDTTEGETGTIVQGRKTLQSKCGSVVNISTWKHDQML